MKCPKCKTKMIVVKSEWGDNNKSNCGNVDLYRCPRCKYENFKRRLNNDRP